MSMTIHLPAELEALLRRTAAAQERSTEDVALDILRAGLVDEPILTLDEVVAQIRVTPPNPASIRPAIGSLAEVLDDDHDADFDLASWQEAWSRIEAEMKAMERRDVARMSDEE